MSFQTLSSFLFPTCLYLTTFLAFHFVSPLINFKTGLLTTPHFVALATSQLFTMENTITTKFDESQMFLIKNGINYLILPASLILYLWFSSFRNAAVKNINFGPISASSVKNKINKDWINIGSSVSSHLLVLSGSSLIAGFNTTVLKSNTSNTNGNILEYSDTDEKTIKYSETKSDEETVEYSKIDKAARAEFIREMIKNKNNKKVPEAEIVAAEKSSKNK